MKFKKLVWGAPEVTEYDGGTEMIWRCYVPALDQSFDICGASGRFYPIWALLPTEGYGTRREAEMAAQFDFEEMAADLVANLVEM